jgi:hypothetical protein
MNCRETTVLWQEDMYVLALIASGVSAWRGVVFLSKVWIAPLALGLENEYAYITTYLAGACI